MSLKHLIAFMCSPLFTPAIHVVPNLHFVAHLPSNIKGEQLLAQLFRCIPERSWLFQYGRVPMSILMSSHVWSASAINFFGFATSTLMDITAIIRVSGCFETM